MTGPIGVYLVDDHPIVRSGVRLLVETEPDLVVVGEAADGETAVDEVLRLRPHVTVMDVGLPGLDGIAATGRIIAAWPEARILALTMHDEDAYVVSFLDEGGRGYVRKSAVDRHLIGAIRQVAGGAFAVDPEAVAAIVSRRHPRPGGRPGPEVLSEREREVLVLTARGFTGREIGERLFISARTVETYRARIMEKLGLDHRSDLVDFALAHRLLS